MNNTAKSLSPRESERNFLYYASVIGKALDQYPLAYAFKPDRAISTVQNMCKSAIVFGLKHGYTSEHIDEEKYRQVGHTLSVGVRGDQVIIGTPASIKAWTGGKQEMVDKGVEPEYKFVGPTHDSLERFCVLLGYLEPQPKIFVKGINLIQRTQIENDHDVVFAADPDDPNKFYIL